MMVGPGIEATENPIAKASGKVTRNIPYDDLLRTRRGTLPVLPWRFSIPQRLNSFPIKHEEQIYFAATSCYQSPLDVCALRAKWTPVLQKIVLSAAAL
jgi:hypothetical protein